MLRMRLQRRGKRNYATYRVVVADRRAPVKGRFVADLGPYNPHTDEFGVKKEEAEKWLSQGVQPSATVHNLLVEHGMLKADKVTSWTPKKKDEAEDGGEAEATAEGETDAEASDDAEATPEEKKEAPEGE